MLTRVDFKKTFDSYQAEHNRFRVLDVPEMQYLMVDGHGDPNTSQEFKDAVAALFPSGSGPVRIPSACREHGTLRDAGSRPRRVSTS